MRHITSSKASSLTIMALVYGMAIFLGVITFDKAFAVMPEIWALLLSDVIATIFVWGMGLAFENVSVYDPYWSVAPPVMFSAWMLYKGCHTLPVILLVIAVWYWGIRLTVNWACTFKGLGHEDWRYTRYRETQPPALFQITNLFGLNMMPTLLVFACMLPGLGLFGAEQAANALTWTGFLASVSAASIQLVADTQIHRFRAAHPGMFCDAGLWKHGRHPNYFGEILFWWGVWIMYASLNGLDWLVLAPIAMTCLFLFISIPMMERRQLENKPGYGEYKKRTRLLI